jgi:hypothetical protein
MSAVKTAPHETVCRRRLLRYTIAQQKIPLRAYGKSSRSNARGFGSRRRRYAALQRAPAKGR